MKSLNKYTITAKIFVISYLGIGIPLASLLAFAFKYGLPGI